MLPKFIKSGSRGFSLVELMIVVAIIGILSALAVPRFQKFQAKAKQSEAKGNLSHIYTLEQSWYGDNDTYVPTGGLAGLGFQVDGGPSPLCGKIYCYTLPASSATAFRAEALARVNIVGGCGTRDLQTITHQKVWANPTNAVTVCP